MHRITTLGFGWFGQDTKYKLIYLFIYLQPFLFLEFWLCPPSVRSPSPLRVGEESVLPELVLLALKIQNHDNSEGWIDGQHMKEVLLGIARSRM